MNYRDKARGLLTRAKAELLSKDDQRLKYAALELRMAMESITYDRAQAYKDEFPPSEYQTWQPRKVMSVLLGIDPLADQDRTLAYGLEEEFGKPATVMKGLGAEVVLNMKLLKDHYDALGSYLHVPTIKQINADSSPNFQKMRERCEDIASYIGAVLLSPVFNVTFDSFSTLNCDECKEPIRRRMPHGQAEVHVECYNDNCCASYVLIDKGNGQVEWRPDQTEIKCASDACAKKIVAWHREIKLGKFWTCPDCGGRNTFVLAVCFEPQELQNGNGATAVCGAAGTQFNQERFS